MNIEEGEFVAFIGPSGCGKTTLLRILAGLERASSGSAKILADWPEEACRKAQIGVAFQRPALVESRTARDNVDLTLEITRATPNQSVKELLEKFGLGEFMDHYPHELSGGMQQRVNIACALVHDPKVLLLDEPFGALDELTREKLGEWLSRLLKEEKRTGILITHSVDEAVHLSDRVVVLSAGPGRVHRVIDIPIPQPRSRSLRGDESFLKLVAEVRRELYAATEKGGAAS
ncbi:MAG: ATP-binding cassette domain-containing protein [Verrucomicrobia bacterium]|nr:ATP-binding cassette domain-containing protein [Verrucomicrobiota bacterium]